jgi:DNA excision repair protein ERCC-4
MVPQEANIVVDDRETGSGIIDILREQGGVGVAVERLPLGDYRIDDALLVERKTLADLVASIKDGRLFGQGCRLAASPLRTVLILEGTGRDLASSGMRREAIQGALMTITLFLGIPLLRSMNPEETARLMLLAARQCRRFADGPLPRRGRRPRGKYRVQARVLQGLPGVGPERARSLLDRFGSLEAVLTADVAQLASVRGIGKGTAEAIRWAVDEPAALYRVPERGIFPL